MCELGKRLKEAREAKGLDLAQAAEALKVRRVVLEALEDCRFDELPEPPLARGYLKRYAQLLGLDPAPLLALYPTSAPQPAALESASSSKMPTTPSPGRLWAVPLVILLLVLGWWGYRSLYRPGTANPTPPAPVAPSPPQQISLRITTQPTGARVYLDGFLLGQAPLEARVEAGERTLRIEAPGYQKYEQVITLQTDRSLSFALTPAPPASSPSPSPNPTTSAPATGLTLRFEGTSWIRVTDGRTGRQLYEGTVTAGAQLNYPLPVVVRVGNAGVVRAIVNGQDRGRMGNVGQVVTQRFGP
ncbi:RodZ domain-containing protein [Meiothermus taiwanensis]|uniref:Cytoskeleton protein RodZ n=1 Tax=Meiothermus taiwanensis TaxID=172827 RepID=A0A399EA32_9DEIN|nr:RodZ domain-containing protein [Meiothermus taiwanensis]RIH79141.1 Cytoskeleton protein RodZ [Meiothermus taiwanensis]